MLYKSTFYLLTYLLTNLLLVLGSTVSAVNDVSADVVSARAGSVNRSPALQFSAADPPRRDSPRQTDEHTSPLMYETGDRSRVPLRRHTPPSWNMELAWPYRVKQNYHYRYSTPN